MNGTSKETTEKEAFQRYLAIIDHDFPLEYLIAGELAQFETYAIPSISKLLHQTALYEKEGLKRLDDTRATMFVISTNPEGSPERDIMVSHLNWVHSHYDISNDDSLYTLLRMFFNPIEWVERWGARKLTSSEINSLTTEMIKIGKSMGIKFYSEDYDALHQWQANYRDQNQRYSNANKYVTFGTIKGIEAHFPRWCRPFIGVLVRSYLKDESLLNALGLKQVNWLQRGMSFLPLAIWKYLSKFYRPWQHKRFSDSWFAHYFPSYKDNKLDCCHLGPSKLIQNRNKKSGCPFH